MAIVSLSSNLAVSFAIDEPVQEIQMAPQIKFGVTPDLSSPYSLSANFTIAYGLTLRLGQIHALVCNMNMRIQFSQAGALPVEFTALVQQASLDDYIQLYKIDCSILGGGVFYFTSSREETGITKFGGNSYIPIDFESEGWEVSGQNQLPTPKVRIANTQMYLTAILQQYDDILGAVVTRTRTFRRFLDGMPQANSLASFKTDVFRVERKASENKFFIELELSSAIDQQGRMLPGRQVLKDICTQRYRVWSDTLGGFDYTYATCPYLGTSYFDKDGNPTIAPNDKCGKRLGDCKDRFGNEGLPGRFFPGVSRVRA